MGTTFFCFVTNHTFDRWTDGQTDRRTDSFLVARPGPGCMQCVQRGKNLSCACEQSFLRLEYPEVVINYGMVQNRRTPGSSFKFVINTAEV